MSDVDVNASNLGGPDSNDGGLVARIEEILSALCRKITIHNGKAIGMCTGASAVCGAFLGATKSVNALEEFIRVVLPPAFVFGPLIYTGIKAIDALRSEDNKDGRGYEESNDISLLELALDVVGVWAGCKIIKHSVFQRIFGDIVDNLLEWAKSTIVYGSIAHRVAAGIAAGLGASLACMPVTVTQDVLGIIYFLTLVGYELYRWMKSTGMIAVLPALGVYATNYIKELREYFGNIEKNIKGKISEVKEYVCNIANSSIKRGYIEATLHKAMDYVGRNVRYAIYGVYRKIADRINSIVSKDSNMPYIANIFRLPNNSAKYLKREIEASTAIM